MARSNFVMEKNQKEPQVYSWRIFFFLKLIKFTRFQFESQSFRLKIRKRRQMRSHLKGLFRPYRCWILFRSFPVCS